VQLLSIELLFEKIARDNSSLNVTECDFWVTPYVYNLLYDSVMHKYIVSRVLK